MKNLIGLFLIVGLSTAAVANPTKVVLDKDTQALLVTLEYEDETLNPNPIPPEDLSVEISPNGDVTIGVERKEVNFLMSLLARKDLKASTIEDLKNAFGLGAVGPGLTTPAFSTCKATALVLVKDLELAVDQDPVTLHLHSAMTIKSVSQLK